MGARGLCDPIVKYFGTCINLLEMEQGVSERCCTPISALAPRGVHRNFLLFVFWCLFISKHELYRFSFERAEPTSNRPRYTLGNRATKGMALLILVVPVLTFGQYGTRTGVYVPTHSQESSWIRLNARSSPIQCGGREIPLLQRGSCSTEKLSIRASRRFFFFLSRPFSTS